MDVVGGDVGRAVVVGRIPLTSAWDEAGGADIRSISAGQQNDVKIKYVRACVTVSSKGGGSQGKQK